MIAMHGKSPLLPLLLLAALLAGGSAAAAEPGLHGPALLHRIERARTRADHEQIAVHFEAQARELRGKAQEHEAMARAYERPSSGVDDGVLRGHCISLAAKLRAAAEERDVLANIHRRTARSLPEKP
jgi:hypothetical protein